jgi:glycosyltransferase involved in cell wall biosynthesis
MLRCLHRRHEVHYLAFRAKGEEEGVERSGEYCTRAYPITFDPVDKTSWKFAVQLGGGVFQRLPLAVSRYHSAAMQHKLESLLQVNRFHYVVCDFPFPAVNFPSMKGVVLFQHNVETMIWRRRVEHARNPVERAYLQLQASRMFRFEKQTCQAAEKVIAVSPVDAKLMREMFGLTKVGDVATGVNLDYFARPAAKAEERDLVFVGSMDWAPNTDGVVYFVKEVLPRIRQKRPGTTLDVVGRDPGPEMRELARQDPNIRVTGTVADVRPYLWGAKVSIVPLRIGGGTRLKIYEAMAAGVPTVSTRIGAEGLMADHPTHIRLADRPEEFARECLQLLEDPEGRLNMADQAWSMVKQNHSWETVARQWEDLLDDA